MGRILEHLKTRPWVPISSLLTNMINVILFLGKTPHSGVLSYCHRVRRPASSLLLFVQSEAVVCLENGLTQNHQMLHAPSHPLDLQSHRIWGHYVLQVARYRRSKSGENDASDGFNLEPPKLIHTSTSTSCQQYRIWRHWLLPASSFRSSKNTQKCRFRRLSVEF